ncbi:DUF1289 domain-containing protein [Algicella marina]|uniref:DUF1289 domain-containing protein n=1 Tax=Algicella marina TaxID=2683284 RepID=A0A6P1SYL5_9RHOB|nr:DUF1289 domain-containing protein [Algicella marina]QHQ34453.1 DUF1289 domain-containing protein [Algicella marina]
MSDDIWRRERVISPCVKICVLHPDSQLCIGCLRSGEEIANWSQMSSEARAEIMAVLPERKPLLQSRRKGGRKGRHQ